MTKINNLIEDFWETILDYRKWLHENPELSGQEKNTAAFIANALREMGLEPKENIGGYGVAAVIEGKSDGKCLALRADFDALPLTENTGLSFSSKTPGVFHACGHDIHTAMLLGVANILMKIRHNFSGKIKLIFQPSEENASDSGAKKMIEEGVLENPKVDAIIGQHVNPHFKTGQIAIKDGSMTASSDRFFISIYGKSSHGSEPEGGIDAITIGAQIITAIQTIVSRSVSPLDNSVISIGKVSGGTRYNVIANRFEMEGTCRNLNPSVRESMPAHIENIVKGIAEGMGGSYDFSYVTGYSPTMNNSRQFELIKNVATEILNENNVIIPQKVTLTGEDFSFYGEKIPAAFYFLGCQKEGTDFYALHNEKFSPDENAMKIGINIMVSSALKYLE